MAYHKKGGGSLSLNHRRQSYRKGFMFQRGTPHTKSLPNPCQDILINMGNEKEMLELRAILTSICL